MKCSWPKVSIVNQKHKKENVSPKKRQARKYKLVVLLTFVHHTSLPTTDCWWEEKAENIILSSDYLCPSFLLLLTAQRFCYFTSSYPFPVPKQLILLIHLPCSGFGSSQFFPVSSLSASIFLLVFFLYLFCAFFFPFLASHPFIISFFLYRILIFPSVLLFCLSGGWIWRGVTLFWDT